MSNTRKLALFISSGTEEKTPEEILRGARALEEWADGESVHGYTRVTEYVTMEFPIRPSGEYVPEQINDLIAKKVELRKELDEQLAKIDALIGTLAAIEHKPE